MLNVLRCITKCMGPNFVQCGLLLTTIQTRAHVRYSSWSCKENLSSQPRFNNPFIGIV
jgi:hypothetical protein